MARATVNLSAANGFAAYGRFRSLCCVLRPEPSDCPCRHGTAVQTPKRVVSIDQGFILVVLTCAYLRPRWTFAPSPRLRLGRHWAQRTQGAPHTRSPHPPPFCCMLTFLKQSAATHQLAPNTRRPQAPQSSTFCTTLYRASLVPTVATVQAQVLTNPQPFRYRTSVLPSSSPCHQPPYP